LVYIGGFEIFGDVFGINGVVHGVLLGIVRGDLALFTGVWFMAW
jgi:hypothetical protein